MLVVDLDTLQVVAELGLDGYTLESMTLSGDERLVVTTHDSRRGFMLASFSHSSIIWDVKSGKRVTQLSGYDAAVKSAEFEQNGRRLLTTASDQSARFWDVKTGMELAVFRSGSTVHDAGFRSGGSDVAVAASLGVWTWHAFSSTQTMIDYACRLAPHPLSPRARERFLLGNADDGWRCGR